MTVAEPQPGQPGEPAPGSSEAASPGLLDACPYLQTTDGRWHLAAPSRQHRCARRPSVPPGLVHQRAYCLSADHPSCELFGAPPGTSAELHARFLPPVPVVIDPGSSPLRVPAADRRIVAPLAVVAVGVGLGAMSLFGGGLGGRPTPAPSPSIAPASAAIASLLPSPAPSPASPLPSPSPSPSAQPSPTPKPKPSVTPRPTPASTHSYTVKKGDTLYGIAQAYHTTVAAIAALNNLKAPYVIHVGEVLKLP